MTQERGDNNTLRQRRMAAHLLGCSLREGHDTVRHSWKRSKRQLAEAVSCHMDDMYLSREWSKFTEVVIVRRVPLPRTGSTTFVMLGYAIDQSCVDVEEVDPNFEVGALIFDLGCGNAPVPTLDGCNVRNLPASPAGCVNSSTPSRMIAFGTITLLNLGPSTLIASVFFSSSPMFTASWLSTSTTSSPHS